MYHSDGVQTSRLKIKNPEYSQMTGRRELFERRRDLRARTHGGVGGPRRNLLVERLGYLD